MQHAQRAATSQRTCWREQGTVLGSSAGLQRIRLILSKKLDELRKRWMRHAVTSPPTRQRQLQLQRQRRLQKLDSDSGLDFQEPETLMPGGVDCGSPVAGRRLDAERAALRFVRSRERARFALKRAQVRDLAFTRRSDSCLRPDRIPDACCIAPA